MESAVHSTTILNLWRVQYNLNQNIKVNNLFTLQDSGKGEGSSGGAGGAGGPAEPQMVCIFFLNIFRPVNGQN